MLKNLICLNFLILTELSINIVVFALHNKILLWRGNISIFFALLELCEFNHRFLFNFGVTVFYMLLISLTSSLHLYCMIKHLLNSFFTSFQIILISRSLAAYVLPQPLLIQEPNSLHGQGNVFFWVIPTMLKGIRFLILSLILSLSLGMSSFMKLFSLLFQLLVVLSNNLPYLCHVFLLLILFLITSFSLNLFLLFLMIQSSIFIIPLMMICLMRYL